MEIIFQYLDKNPKKKIYVIFFFKTKGIIYKNYNNWIFMHRFAKEIFFSGNLGTWQKIYFSFIK